MTYILLFLCLTLKVDGLDIPTTITTNLGDVLGIRHVELYTKKPVYEFRRIPYARPPVQSLRFKRPKPYGYWPGTLDATKFGPSCYQDDIKDLTSASLPNDKISENCLFLNIYVPNNISRTNNYSVMVWIHGGDYDKGSGITFNGALLACIGEVIVVTVNYRLGVFGFLSTGDRAAEGNYGLWDQRLALIWIKNSIQSYGGDPASITVFGHSAGAMSITVHSLSTKNKGLFRRIILQSGFGTSTLTMSNDVPSNTKKIAALVNCSSDTSLIMINCLRNVTDKDLQTAYKGVIREANVKLSPLFGPVVDGKYIVNMPRNMLTKSNSEELRFYQSLDILIGNVENEGSGYIKLLKKYQLDNRFNFSLSNGIPKSVLYDEIIPKIEKQMSLSRTKFADAVCNKYGKSTNLEQQGSDQLDFYGDMMFYSPTEFALNAHSNNVQNNSGKCFQYNFRRQTIYSLTGETPTWVKGATHGAEINFIFPFPELLNNSPPDGKLALTMVKYWTNFAKTGDVNDGNDESWPEFDPVGRRYAVLDTNITIESHFRKSHMQFWMEEVPKLLQEEKRSNSSNCKSIIVLIYFLLCYCLIF